MNAPTNSDDVIDSRDVIERLEELEATKEAFEATEEHITWESVEPDEAEELKSLTAFASEAEGYSDDWLHGATLIRDSHFRDYIEELINDCYELPKAFNSGEWPYRHMKLDYEAAAEEAQSDYTSVDFDDVTYWVR